MANLVEIVVRATDDTKSGFAAAAASGDSLGAKLSKIGMIGGAALGAVAVASVVMATKFDSAMTMIQTQAGVAQNKIAGLKTGVLALAGQVGFSPDSLADALYHIESSFASVGITGPKALNLLKIAAEGAAIGHANLTDVTNALDAAIVSGIPGVQNFGQAMGVLNATVGSGDMKMQDLAEAFGTGMLAVVKGYGLSIKDVGAALAVFGDNNIRGAQAGTELRMAVQALAVPAKAGAATLASLGMSTTQLAKDMQTGGLLKALEDLKDHMDKAGVSATEQGQIITTIFGKKAGTGIDILIGQLDRLKSKYPDLAKGAGGFASAWAATQATVAQKWKELESGVDALAIKFGEVLMPAVSAILGFLVNKVLPGITKVGTALGKMIPVDKIKQDWGKVTSFLGAFFDAPKVVNAVTPGLTPQGTGPGAYTKPVAAAPRSPFMGMVDDVKKVGESLGKAITPAIKSLWSSMVTYAKGLWGAFKDLLPYILDLKKPFEDIAKIFGGIVGLAIIGFFAGIAAIVKILVGPLKDITLAVLAAVVAWKAWTVATALFDAVMAIDPFVAIATAIIILVGLVVKYHTQIWAFIVKIWGDIEKFVEGLWNDVVKWAEQNWLLVLLGPAGLIVKYHNDIWQFIQTIWHTIYNFFASIIGAIVNFFKSSWDKIWSDVKSVWGSISSWFSSFWTGEVNGWKNILSTVESIFSNAWKSVESTAKTVWGGIASFFSGLKTTVKNAFDDVVNGIKTAWGGVEAVFKAPVNFLIGTVYDNGIERLWNDVMGAIHGPLLPHVNTLASGGLLPGFGGGDRNLALLEDGEAVVDKHRTRKFAPLLKAMGVPGFSGGGIIGDLTGALGWLGGEAAGLVSDLEKGSGKVLEGILMKLIGNGGASGDLATMITGIPKTLINDLIGSVTFTTSAKKIAAEKAAADAAAAAVTGAVGGGVSQSAAAYASQIRQVLSMTGEPASDLGAVEHRITVESGGNPTIVNKWDSNWAAGHPSVGLMQVIAGTFQAYAGQYRNTGPFEYGVSTNPMANIYAGVNYAKHAYNRSLYSVMMQAGGYASGGIGGGMAVVGEHGRELVKLPQGSTVYSNSQSESMMARMLAGGGGTVQLEVSSGGQSAFEQFMLKMLREQVRVKGGGSVQKAFGSGSH